MSWPQTTRATSPHLFGRLDILPHGFSFTLELLIWEIQFSPSRVERGGVGAAVQVIDEF